MEKLRTIGKLSAKETAEYNNIIRLVGLMIHLLLDQKYDDKEMMDSLLKRYEKYASEQGMVLNSPNI
jgi:1-aminocyclopropane-1-carboxylate deaminase/D-cysteine desulfhydrase-like pyridoxal-dependent ACC family enzyme